MDRIVSRKERVATTKHLLRRSDGSTRRDDEILTSGSKKRMNGKLSAFIKLKRIADDPRRSIDF
jgi:hypothetical protein